MRTLCSIPAFPPLFPPPKQNLATLLTNLSILDKCLTVPQDKWTNICLILIWLNTIAQIVMRIGPGESRNWQLCSLFGLFKRSWSTCTPIRKRTRRNSSNKSSNWRYQPNFYKISNYVEPWEVWIRKWPQSNIINK